MIALKHLSTWPKWAELSFSSLLEKLLKRLAILRSKKLLQNTRSMNMSCVDWKVSGKRLKIEKIKNLIDKAANYKK